MNKGNLPEGWCLKQLESLGTTYSGLSGKTKRDFGIGKPYLTYLNIYSNSKVDISKVGYVSITDGEKQNEVKFGDILFTTSSETLEEVGMSSVFLDNVYGIYLNSFCFGFRLYDFNSLTPEYAQYLFRGEDVRKVISVLGQGSTRINISKNTFVRKLFLKLPPLPEQLKIAEILSTIDNKIGVIDEQIARTQELKKGLMQQLFNKGIGHTVFEESSHGRIPSDWSIALLDEVSKRGSGHTPSKSFPHYYDGDINWVSLADSSSLDNRWIKSTKYTISEAGIKNSSAVLHQKGTVLMSRDAGIGKSAIMYEDMAVSQHFITWTCGSSLNNWFLYYYLQKSKPLFERIAVGSTIKTIGLPFFKKFTIPLPPIEEQESIAEILFTVDDKLSILQKKKDQYLELKKGLMQQLLSGKLRVNHLIEEPELV